jgi:hypothetical protein
MNQQDDLQRCILSSEEGDEIAGLCFPKIETIEPTNSLCSKEKAANTVGKFCGRANGYVTVFTERIEAEQIKTLSPSIKHSTQLTDPL